MSNIKPVYKVPVVNNHRKPIKHPLKPKRNNLLDFEGYYDLALLGKLPYPAAI